MSALKYIIRDTPLVMGIINATPDSFYSGSRQQGVDAILRKAGEMIREGAAIIDVGGQSTRPGSERVEAGEELRRVLEPVAALHRAFPETLISIDTYHARVALETVQAGAGMVNDVSAGSLDPELWEVVARLGVPYVLMHMQGRPDTMQTRPEYGDVTGEVNAFFREKTGQLLERGIRDIVLDPGFGFGKTPAHNLRLLRDLGTFLGFGYPVLLGVSRKSTISRILQVEPADTLNGTTVLHTIGLLHGASILRAHDVKEAVEAIRLVQAYREAGK